MSNRVARLDSAIGVFQIDAGKHEFHQPKDSLDFAFNRVAQQSVGMLTQNPKNLVRAIVAHDLRKHDRFDKTAIELRMFVKFLELVERGDHPESQHAVS